jgi:cytidine deaminase
MENENKNNQELLSRAKQAAAQAYAPYSKLRVGAAILTAEGSVFTGCNIENPSYSATICAERAALACVVSGEGPTARIRAIAVWCGDKRPCYPCGICRQALLPWCEKDATLAIESADGTAESLPFAGLLPNPFANR